MFNEYESRCDWSLNKRKAKSVPDSIKKSEIALLCQNGNNLISLLTPTSTLKLHVISFMIYDASFYHIKPMRGTDWNRRINLDRTRELKSVCLNNCAMVPENLSDR